MKKKCRDCDWQVIPSYVNMEQPITNGLCNLQKKWIQLSSKECNIRMAFRVIEHAVNHLPASDVASKTVIDSVNNFNNFMGSD